MEQAADDPLSSLPVASPPEKVMEEGFRVTRVTPFPFFRRTLSDPFKEQEQTKLFQLSLKSCRKGQERKVRLLTWPHFQVVVQVATPPPAGPVKKTYRKVKKTPVVPKPEDQ